MKLMQRVTRLEDCSNEIFMDILDHLHAIDTFRAFGSVNRRISSILHSINLHLVISYKTPPRPIQLLSSYLFSHSHQVISLSIDDDTPDRSSAIEFLFKRHRFDNLHSCSLRTPSHLPGLPVVLQQLESWTELRHISVVQAFDVLHEGEKHRWSHSLLNRMRSSALRSLCLHYYYDHCRTLNTITPVTANLTHLEMILDGKPQHVSIDSVYCILQGCPRLRWLRLTITNMIDGSEQPGM